MAHLIALLLALGWYATLALALLGWGRVLRRALQIPPGSADGPFLDLWLGWTVLLGLLQFLHLFAPLRAWTVVPLLALGIVFCFRSGPVPFALPRSRPGTAAVLCTGTWLIAALWVSARAMQTPLEFDGGLYHFHAIRWINEARIMPGLGNLHGRLAFNSAFHAFVAALNLSPLFGHGRAIANSFLCLVVLAQILHRLHRALPRTGTPGTHADLAPLANLLALPLVGYLALTSLGLASPSADLASSFVQIAVFLLLVDGLDSWRAQRPGQEVRIAALVLLSVTLVTLKLSNLGFAAGVAALCAAYSRPARLAARRARSIAAVAVALAAIWVARGYVLSGYPCYPSTFGGIAFDWMVPAEQTQRDTNAVYSWARQPWADAKEVLGNTRWLDPWLYRARHNLEGIVAPVGIALLAALAAFAIRLVPRRRPTSGAPGPWWPAVSIASGLFFWWFTAPDPRFANALLWLLPIAALLALAASAEARLDYRPPAAVIVTLVLLCNAHFALWVVRHPESLRDISWNGWQPLLPPGFTPRATSSGLVVNTYRYSPEELIWDGPRPATPDFNPRLRLRVPEKPEFGFTTR